MRCVCDREVRELSENYELSGDEPQITKLTRSGFEQKYLQSCTSVEIINYQKNYQVQVSSIFSVPAVICNLSLKFDVRCYYKYRNKAFVGISCKNVSTIIIFGVLSNCY